MKAGRARHNLPKSSVLEERGETCRPWDLLQYGEEQESVGLNYWRSSVIIGCTF